MRRSLLALAALALWRCGPAETAEPPSAPLPTLVDPLALARSSLAILGPPSVGGGTGVYLGDGLVLTNWHVAVTSAIVDLAAQEAFGLDLPRSEYLEEFAEGTPGAAPVEGAVSPDDAYCITSSTATTAAAIVRHDGLPMGRESCAPVVSLDHSLVLFPSLSPPPPAARALSARLAWASIGIDLAIGRIPVAEVERAYGALPRLPIDVRPSLAYRAPVWVIGYPATVLARPPFLPRVELCWTEVPAVERLRDPDLEQPSDLVVTSFGIDCGSVGPGSSGSMVVDAESGALVGLVWTGSPDGLVWVTPASAWLERLDSAPEAPENRPLAELLRGARGR